MCGIFAVCHCNKASGKTTARFCFETAKKHAHRQKHRGPDYRGFYQNEQTGDILCHERLSIMDLSYKCAHPIQGSQPNHQVIHNGEIYNHAILRQDLLKEFAMRTECDSETIIYLYEKIRNGMMCNQLDGIFTFALIYEKEFLVARDPIGIKPLYYGIDKEGRYLFSSEMKIIEDICGENFMKTFPPGHFWTPENGFVRYFNPLWLEPSNATNEANLLAIREALTAATIKRLISDAPLGVLLSGGLDSSLVSSIASREMRLLGYNMMSFSIALDEFQPDTVAARKVAKFIGTEHHEFHFTIKEGIDNLRNLIWHLETYDVTSIRASTPMFFLSKKISELGVKVVLSGEGADEIFGGYLYFHNAPDDYAFQQETIRRVNLLSTADCLRADKSCMAHAVEVRVPFLDKAFLEVAMMTHPRYKRPVVYENRPVEKYFLRKAFDDPDKPYLPKEILWRQKEQFSDGVGYNWIDQLRDYCASKVSDEEMKLAGKTFPYNTPTTKEGYYYRKIFHELFPSENAAKTVKKWVPKWQESEDPSGRVCSVHLKRITNETEKSGVRNSTIMKQSLKEQKSMTPRQQELCMH
ncbi:unnamed protein product [Enterobius vermicularis]|uniref:Asparagine synthetase [glutamine-hydrolyzing] n=1 Tax=Enterobius vermicularis TaxID=51028 RepID=A0A0N4V4I5_ENTVE|nr:unnamed protein product [Enterobius vermicularis]